MFPHCESLFVCFITSQVNSYGHGGMVSSPKHTFFPGRLEQAVNQYFVHILSLVTDIIARHGTDWATWPGHVQKDMF